MADVRHVHDSPQGAGAGTAGPAPPAFGPNLPPVDPTMPRPFWSVVVPVCERTTYLKQCLDSVLDQGLGAEDMEVLVQDDCSSCDLLPLVQRLGNGRVQYQRNRVRLGQFPSVNDALRRTRGQWIHILHDDDYVRPPFYRTFRSSLAGLPPAVGMACCHYTVLRLADGLEWRPPVCRPDAGVLNNWLARLAVDNPHNVAAVVHRRAVFERLGLLRDDLPATADWEYYVRAATAFQWWYQPQDMAVYRMHDDSQTAHLGRRGQLAEDLRRTIEIIERYLPDDVRRRAIPTARAVHGRRFVFQARGALQDGHPELALAILNQCAKLWEPGAQVAAPA
jgi:protein O-GlcNAc transferase